MKFERTSYRIRFQTVYRFARIFIFFSGMTRELKFHEQFEHDMEFNFCYDDIDYFTTLWFIHRSPKHFE